MHGGGIVGLAGPADMCVVHVRGWSAEEATELNEPEGLQLPTDNCSLLLPQPPPFFAAARFCRPNSLNLSNMEPEVLLRDVVDFVLDTSDLESIAIWQVDPVPVFDGGVGTDRVLSSGVLSLDGLAGDVITRLLLLSVCDVTRSALSTATTIITLGDTRATKPEMISIV